ncbi:MAG: hypothetical protein QXF09_06245 [Nitrososphaerota archaeon]
MYSRLSSNKEFKKIPFIVLIISYLLFSNVLDTLAASPFKERLNLITDIVIKALGIHDKSFKENLNKVITQNTVPGGSRLTEVKHILYPEDKVLFSPTEEILIMATNEKFKIAKVYLNNQLVFSGLSNKVLLPRNLLKRINDVSLYYEKIESGRIIRNIYPITSQFELVDIENIPLLKREYERARTLGDKLSENLYKLAVLAALQEMQGQDFEFQYDLNKYIFIVKPYFMHESVHSE